MKIICLGLLILVSVLAALGNLCFKKAAKRKGKNLLQNIFSVPFILGGCLFVICPVLSAFCAKYVDFTVMYAMTAMNFVFILMLSRLFLKERLDAYKVVGVALIMTGVCLMVFTEFSI